MARGRILNIANKGSVMQGSYFETSKIKRVLSESRLKGYETSYAKSLHINPIILYQWNLTLSETLYPLLHLVEVGFRNALNEAIIHCFKNKNWLLESEFLFAIETEKIASHAYRLKKNGQLDHEHLIADLNFGFWCNLLDRRYEIQQLLWPQLLRTVFPFLKDRKLHLIRKRFNLIRKLRNRIYHYEAIWHWGNLLDQHQGILEAIAWIEPELLKLLESDRFPEIYRGGPE